jgi:hypothetical protein
MKFWTRLRWISTAVFAALLMWSWWAGDAAPSAEPSAPTRNFTF